MDAVLPEAQELSAALRWGGHASPHELAQVLSLLLPLLPLDDRARAACVCRAWRAAAAHPALWKELSFERCAADVDDTTLAALCARGGAALRTLSVDAGACERVTGAGIMAALLGGGCTGVRRLSTQLYSPWDEAGHTLNAEQVQQLAAACPLLQVAASVLQHASERRRHSKLTGAAHHGRRRLSLCYSHQPPATQPGAMSRARARGVSRGCCSTRV